MSKQDPATKITFLMNKALDIAIEQAAINALKIERARIKMELVRAELGDTLVMEDVLGIIDNTLPVTVEE